MAASPKPSSANMESVYALEPAGRRKSNVRTTRDHGHPPHQLPLSTHTRPPLRPTRKPARQPFHALEDHAHFVDGLAHWPFRVDCRGAGVDCCRQPADAGPEARVEGWVQFVKLAQAVGDQELDRAVVECQDGLPELRARASQTVARASLEGATCVMITKVEQRSNSLAKQSTGYKEVHDT